ncbi:hypothetical protein NFI96_028389, partial [Prochilodus magdalenae]
SVICAGVNSTEHFVQMNVSCDTSVQELACSQVTGLTAEDLANILTCSVSNNITYPKEIWKLLFTKAEDILPQALINFSRNATDLEISSVFASDILDVIADVLLEQLSIGAWDNVNFIRSLFTYELRPFLPFASSDLLFCISSKNFSCQTYQMILNEFSDQILLLDMAQKQRVLKDFILPFLTKNSSDPGCVNSANDSVEWLMMNFGPFAGFMTIKQLISLNPNFDPLLVLPDLTARQLAEVLVEDLPYLPHKEYVINTVFDFLLETPWQVPEVLQNVLMLIKNDTSCSFFTPLSSRLFWALSLVPQDLQLQCWDVPARRVWSLVPSFEELIQDLVNGSFTFSLEQYACSQLDGYTGEDLALLMRHILENNIVYTTPVWKLLFIKTLTVLDDTLRIFSSMAGNQSLPISGTAVSNVLDALREVQLELFTHAQWSDAAFISSYFRENLRPYLASVSRDFLSCLMTKNLTCQTFQDIVQELSNESNNMSAINHEPENVLRFLILPFLRMNTEDPDCVSSTNDSVEWLLRNFGNFAELLSLRELVLLNPYFNPVLALYYLTPQQTAELMVMEIPGLPIDYVINGVFDFLTQPSGLSRLPGVLMFLSDFSQKVTIPCTSYELM